MFQVVVGLNSSFQVLDHDFSRCSITPSVVFKVSIPESVDQSWYQGSVYVGLKDSVFQPSSPYRHSAELKELISSRIPSKEVMAIYSDGGMYTLMYNYDFVAETLGCFSGPSLPGLLVVLHA